MQIIKVDIFQGIELNQAELHEEQGLNSRGRMGDWSNVDVELLRGWAGWGWLSMRVSRRVLGSVCSLQVSGDPTCSDHPYLDDMPTRLVTACQDRSSKFPTTFQISYGA